MHEHKGGGDRMKFKTEKEYKPAPLPLPPTSAVEPAVPRIDQSAPKPTTQPAASLFMFFCICCDANATVLHKGTGYCKPCYAKRNYDATLIG